MKLTFIESWYDPPKAIEATYAQVAAGADVVYQMAGEVYEACEDRQIYCLSKYKDTSSMAPDVVLSGTQLLWEPGLRWILDEWYTHKTTGQPLAGNMEPVWFSMAEGGSDISPYHGLADMVSGRTQESCCRRKGSHCFRRVGSPRDHRCTQARLNSFQPYLARRRDLSDGSLRRDFPFPKFTVCHSLAP